MRIMLLRTLIGLASLATFAYGCGGPSQEAAPIPPISPAAPTAQPSAETFQTFGNYEIHFNAVRTDQLTPEVARAYGIQRSGNRVLLNVTMLRKGPEGMLPVGGTVGANAYNLNGQLKDLELRQITEGEAVYYIGEVSISGTEILVFEISAQPSGESTAFEVKFKREFFTD